MQITRIKIKIGDYQYGTIINPSNLLDESNKKKLCNIDEIIKIIIVNNF